MTLTGWSRGNRFRRQVPSCISFVCRHVSWSVPQFRRRRSPKMERSSNDDAGKLLDPKWCLLVPKTYWNLTFCEVTLTWERPSTCHQHPARKITDQDNFQSKGLIRNRVLAQHCFLVEKAFDKESHTCVCFIFQFFSLKSFVFNKFFEFPSFKI